MAESELIEALDRLRAYLALAPGIPDTTPIQSGLPKACSPTFGDLRALAAHQSQPSAVSEGDRERVARIIAAHNGYNPDGVTGTVGRKVWQDCLPLADSILALKEPGITREIGLNEPRMEAWVDADGDIQVEVEHPSPHDVRGEDEADFWCRLMGEALNALDDLAGWDQADLLSAQLCAGAIADKIRAKYADPSRISRLRQPASPGWSKDGSTVTLPDWCARDILAYCLAYCDAKRERREAVLCPIGAINWLRHPTSSDGVE